MEDRLADLFGEGQHDEPKVEKTPEVELASDFDDADSDIQDAPILEEDNGNVEESPLKELKSLPRAFSSLP